MLKENTIEVKNISKSFKVYFDKGHELKEKVLFRKRNRYEIRKVLNEISFGVKKGEAIALIGKNGCGKSTMLKMLNKIIYPDSGEIIVNGRISSLLELGAGFHPDMSGRENIYINASIFGLTKSEIEKRVNQIITFSELEEFIDNPVRTYSSGMYMRLAFSVAINVDADVLLIDEILGVGDASFQQKCFNKLLEIKNQGITIVVVSHSSDQIEKICDRSIWIEDGMIREIGNPAIINEHYKEVMKNNRELRDLQESEIISEEELQKAKMKAELPAFCCEKSYRYGNKKMYFADFHITDLQGIDKNIFNVGEVIRLRYKIENSGLEEKINVAFRLSRGDGVLCFASDYATHQAFEKPENWSFLASEEISEIITDIELNNQMMPGKYYIDVVITKEGLEVYDEISHIADISIDGKQPGIGIVNLQTSWNIGECNGKSS